MNVATNLAPPVLWAFFSKVGAWPARQITASRQIFRSNAELKFDGADVGALGLQCYVLPSQGDGAMGIRLPANGVALYMFTTTQDGCTFKVSGDPLSPFVSHANASTTLWANKPGIINCAIASMLDAVFDPGAFRAPGNDPTVNVGTLDYFDSNDPLGLGFVRSNSPQSLQHMQNLLHGSNGLKVREDNHWYNHENITWSLSAATANTLTNPQTMPNALVIGQRAGANQPWSFFYQETTDITLVKHTQKKMGRINVGSNNQNVTGRAILSYGRLWPAPTTATIFPMYN